MRRNIAVTKVLTVLMSVCAVLLFFGLPVKAEFKHNAIQAEIPFTCAKINSTKLKNEYEIVIEKLDDSFPDPDTETAVISGSGDGMFTITIDEPGTYHYRIYEKAGSNSKIIYDSTEYTVTLFVTSDDDGTLEYQVVLSKGGLIKPTEVCFANKAVKSMVATGESANPFIYYALAAIVLGGAILILAFRRRKEDINV